MPKNAFFFFFFFFTNSRSSGQPKNDAKTLFFTLHPLSPVIFATATVVAFVLLRNSRFNFHYYTQCEAMPTQKSDRKWCCNISWLLAWKITKGMHSCRPASQNRPTVHHQGQKRNLRTILHPPSFNFTFCCTVPLPHSPNSLSRLVQQSPHGMLTADENIFL